MCSCDNDEIQRLREEVATLKGKLAGVEAANRMARDLNKQMEARAKAAEAALSAIENYRTH